MPAETDYGMPKKERILSMRRNNGRFPGPAQVDSLSRGLLLRISNMLSLAKQTRVKRKEER